MTTRGKMEDKLLTSELNTAAGLSAPGIRCIGSLVSRVSFFEAIVGSDVVGARPICRLNVGPSAC